MTFNHQFSTLYMKNFLLHKIRGFIFLLLAGIAVHAQDKTIYITLDVSGSMGVNNKYEYANYASQVIALLNKDKKVVLIIGARPIDISGKNGYKKIQRYFSFRRTQIDDIDAFNRIFDPSKPNQEIFIIGDGIWGRDKRIEREFVRNVESGNLRVTFLETLESKDEETDFEKFLRSKNIGKIYKTDSSKDLIESINTIVEEISGVKNLPRDEYKVEGNCLRFKLLLNAKYILFMYQDAARLKALPKIRSVKVDGKEKDVVLLGRPTTETFAGRRARMSSLIYKLDKPVKAGSEVVVCFDKPFDPAKLKIFPAMDAEIGGIRIATDNTKTKQIDANTVAVCEKENRARIEINVTQDGHALTPEALKRTEIYIWADGRKYKAEYNASKGVFEAVIPLKSIETTYSIESIIGYKRINSGQKKIIKTKDCEPLIPPLETQELPEQTAGILRLKDAGCDETFRVQILDEKTKMVLDPSQFDIEVDNNYKYLFKKAEVSLAPGNLIVLKLQSRGFWCPCFIPDKVTFNFKAKPKGYIEGKVYKELHVPLTVEIDKSGYSWWQRCAWLIYSLLGSILLFWYFWKLSRKKRFRRGAKIILKVPAKGKRNKFLENFYPLRKKGFVAWLNRWLNPFGTENRRLSFVDLGYKSFHFYASASDRKILFPKANFDKKAMKYVNYDEDSKDKFVEFEENSEIILKRKGHGGAWEKVYMRYYYPRKDWNDKKSFRAFTFIIITALMLYIILVIILLILSIF